MNPLTIKIYAYGTLTFRLRLMHGDDIRKDITTSILDQVTRTISLWTNWGATLSDDDDTTESYALYERLDAAR